MQAPGPADGGVDVIGGLNAASGGLYALTQKGAYSQVLRVPAGTTQIEEIALSTKGHISEAFTDPRRPGIAINFSSWVMPRQEYEYDPRAKSFADLGIEVRGDINPANFVVSDLEARSGRDSMISGKFRIKDDPKPPRLVVA